MAINDSSSLSSLFKEVYGNVTNLLPDFAKIQKGTKFISAEKQNGLQFTFPLLNSYENSVTFASPDSGLFSLEPINGMATSRVQVKGSNLLLRAGIDNETLARSSNSRSAFAKATSTVVDNLMQSGASFIESLILYGESPSGLGTVDGYTSVSSTRVILHFTPASFAVGIWNGRINAKLELYDTTGTNKQGGANSYFTIVSVDSVNSKITVDGDASASITDIKTYLDSNDCSVFWKGSRNNSMNGLDRLITNTGTIYNVDAGAVDLWKGNTYSVSGTLTQTKINLGIAQAVNKGLTDSATLYVSTSTFMNLISDQSALRVYDSSYSGKTFENGATKLMFNAPNGVITIEVHPMVKPSEAFLVPKDKLLRIGASDFSFNYGGNDEYMFPIADKAGKEIRLFTNQGLVATTPAQFVKYTNITV